MQQSLLALGRTALLLLPTPLRVSVVCLAISNGVAAADQSLWDIPWKSLGGSASYRLHLALRPSG